MDYTEEDWGEFWFFVAPLVKQVHNVTITFQFIFNINW